ncbi:uncharacterized protein LOC133639037 isoform X1 [Entelurus aequoreus]|uniref:uncharacterized protein LOC133639037 isoform X1 n=1 Tax=Entelurus aequoreus TaxID=161455 RepID=UPI002B1DC9E8|nr:uncharacterized protein LOC133639037 isoform X1 [Entelurus aequoreus]
MDDKLIQAVFDYPQLYDVTLVNYRQRESRASAWTDISVSLGLPVDECKRKWKNLRDRYLKEVRLEIRNKKQGEPSQSKWRYRQRMNFIAPFTGSNSGVAEVCDDDDDDNGEHEGETTPSEKARTPPIAKSTGGQADTKSLAVLIRSLSSPDTRTANMPPQMGKSRRKRQPVQNLPLSGASPPKWAAKESGLSLPSRPRDEDELFLLSFVPALKRLAPQRRCETKMKIQQIMYEAEFNMEQVERREKKHLD